MTGRAQLYPNQAMFATSGRSLEFSIRTSDGFLHTPFVSGLTEAVRLVESSEGRTLLRGALPKGVTRFIATPMNEFSYSHSPEQ